MLEVKKSLISNAGLGVFATQDIDAGVELTEYHGLVCSDYSEVQDELATALLYTDEFFTLGNVNQHSSLQCGQIINDYSKISFAIHQTLQDLENVVNQYIKESTKHANVEMKARSNKHYAYSIKKIKSGEELYFHYGHIHWLMFLKNKLKLKPDIIKFINNELLIAAQEQSLINDIRNFSQTLK